jgi:hypothetical protein
LSLRHRDRAQRDRLPARDRLPPGEALTFDPETIVGLERKVVLQIGGYTIVGKIDLAWVKGDRAGVTTTRRR